MKLLQIITLPSLTLLLSGCPPDKSGDVHDTAETASDARCLDSLVTGQPFPLDPDGPDTQIHVAAAFDGESLWVAYNRPDSAGGFDVYAARLDCDGTTRIAPFQVNTTDHNDLDPALAVADGHVLVAWQSDSGQFPDNLSLLVRSFLVDGTPVMASDRAIGSGNHWMPAVAALPAGFAVAGARAADGATGFQVFLQRFAVDGEETEEAFNMWLDPVASQTMPTIAAMPDGLLHVAYLQATEPDWEDHVMHAAVAAGARIPDPAPAARTEGMGPHLTASPDGSAYLVFADSNTNRVVLTDADDFSRSAPEAALGESGQINHSPVVAAAGSRGAVAWYRHVGGLDNELWVQGFTYVDGAFSLSDARLAVDVSVPPYPSALTHITGDVYFLAWAEGTSPDFRLVGTFLEIE